MATYSFLVRIAVLGCEQDPEVGLAEARERVRSIELDATDMIVNVVEEYGQTVNTPKIHPHRKNVGQVLNGYTIVRRCPVKDDLGDVIMAVADKERMVVARHTIGQPEWSWGYYVDEDWVKADAEFERRITGERLMLGYTDLNLTVRENAIAIIEEQQGDLYDILRVSKSIRSTGYRYRALTGINDQWCAKQFEEIADEIVHLVCGGLRYYSPLVDLEELRKEGMASIRAAIREGY